MDAAIWLYNSYGRIKPISVIDYDLLAKKQLFCLNDCLFEGYTIVKRSYRSAPLPTVRQYLFLASIV